MCVVSAELEVSSADVTERKDFRILVEKDLGLTQDVGFVDPRFVETLGHYHGEFAVLRLFVTVSLFDVVKICRKLLLSDIALETSLAKAAAWKCDSQVEHEVPN